MRDTGFFRSVGVEWFARPTTAENSDFFPSSGSVEFLEDQRSAEIVIYITDDDKVEFLESFTVQLIATSGLVNTHQSNLTTNTQEAQIWVVTSLLLLIFFQTIRLLECSDLLDQFRDLMSQLHLKTLRV